MNSTTTFSTSVSTPFSTSFGRTARKSAVALAIAFVAAAPALAGGPSSHNYSAAGYPVGEAMDFELPSMRSAQVAAMPAPAPAEVAPSSLSLTDTGPAQGDGMARSGEQVAMIEVQQQPQRQQSPITRESVRAELTAARASGTLTQANEAGDTDRVLAAREAFNDEQTATIVAEYQAEYDRQIAMQEAEIRRAAIEAEWLAAGVAQAPGADASTADALAEVQIDVISAEPQAMGE